MFRSLFRELKRKRRLPNAPVPNRENIAKHSLREMLGGQCCRCTQDLSGHRYQIFAMTRASPERHEALLDFFQLAKGHAWESLSAYQDFDGQKNSAQILALQCPTGELTAIYVRDPFELFDSKTLEDWDPLSKNDAQKWAPFLLETKWVAFDGKRS